MRKIHVVLALMVIVLPCLQLGAGGINVAFEDGGRESIAILDSPSFETSINISIPVGYYALNATMCVTGMAAQSNSSTFPESVALKINESNIWCFQKTGYGPLGKQDRFSDNTKQKTLQFGMGGGTNNTAIRLPANCSIQNATMAWNGTRAAKWKELCRFTGAAANDEFGKFVSSAGDVNGDEYDDVIVEARNCYVNSTDPGRAYIFLGGLNIDNIVDVALIGSNSGDFFGHGISSAGDVNNDGYDDVIVGALDNDAGGTDAGRAYIFFGGQNMDNVADIIFTGPTFRTSE